VALVEEDLGFLDVKRRILWMYDMGTVLPFLLLSIMKSRFCLRFGETDRWLVSGGWESLHGYGIDAMMVDTQYKNNRSLLHFFFFFFFFFSFFFFSFLNCAKASERYILPD
jgi:hypothetical protein